MSVFRRTPLSWTALALFALLPTLRAEAQTNVFVDFTNFGTRLNEAAATARTQNIGVSAANFTPAEVTNIQNTILAQLATAYTGFTLNFVTTAPAAGNYERLTYGDTTADKNLFGLADRIDYRNLSANDTARIYSANFSDFIDSPNRPTVVTHVATSLAGTGAHELAHDLGLQHYDPYGDPVIGPSNYNNTGGAQNTHIMATGSTDLSTAQREQVRTFSQLETAKLEFGTGLRASTPASIAEQAAAHSTTITAQGITFTALPLSGLSAANITGSIGAAAETDFYSFSGLAGEKFIADTFTTSIRTDSTGAATGRGSTLDTVLTLFAADGTTVLATNDDITFEDNTIFNGGAYSTESFILNYLLPSNSIYYLRLTSAARTGNYELFVSVPEPGSVVPLVGMAVTFGGVFLRRRRAQRQ